MIQKTLKDQIKPGIILIDDCDLLYQVVEKMANCVIVQEFPNKGDLGCEVMTYKAMENEKWSVVNQGL